LSSEFYLASPVQKISDVLWDGCALINFKKMLALAANMNGVAVNIDTVKLDVEISAPLRRRSSATELCPLTAAADRQEVPV